MIRWEDVTVNLPEFRADQVLLVGGNDDPDRWALHLSGKCVTGGPLNLSGF